MSFEGYYQAIKSGGSLIENLTEFGGKTRKELGPERNLVVSLLRESLRKM